MICVANLQSPDDIPLFKKQRFGNLGHSRAPVREKGGERVKNFRVNSRKFGGRERYKKQARNFCLQVGPTQPCVQCSKK